MRVVAAILYIVLAICSLGIQGYVPSYPSISFNVTGATLITYKDFMWQLREIVSWRTRTNNDLPVLNLESDALVGYRFVLAGLSNDTNHTVTLAIDVVNLYVVAYCFDNESYFFEDATPLQLSNLFNSTHQNQLDFNNSYISLEKVTGVNRTERPLGPGPLLDAIAVLWYSGNLPPSVIAESLITVFEMVSDAARFKYIEEQVRESITRANTFTPKGLIVSMEDEWRSMSKQVLLSDFLVTLWSIWKHRNECLFQASLPNLQELQELIVTRIAIWLKATSTKLHFSINDFLYNISAIRHCING